MKEILRNLFFMQLLFWPTTSVSFQVFMLHWLLWTKKKKTLKNPQLWKTYRTLNFFFSILEKKKQGEEEGGKPGLKLSFFILVPSIIEHDRVFPPLILHLGWRQNCQHTLYAPGWLMQKISWIGEKYRKAKGTSYLSVSICNSKHCDSSM